MKAMVLAAGLGTRLRPLTDTRPKALVEINGRTLLEITLTRLRAFGVNEVIINVHHFADMVADYLKSHNNFGMRIEISREDDLLLDTGGGLKKASWFFLEDTRHSSLATLHSPPEPFFLHNVDVISTIDLQRMLQFHNEQGALATLAVQSRESSRLLLFNDKNKLVGRAPGGKMDNAATQEPAFSSNSPLVHPELRGATRHSPLPLAFCGIHIISPRLLPLLTEEGVFSIIDAYLRLAAQGEKILAFHADEYYWRDLGRSADLSQAAFDLQQGVVG
ncbi:MAG TPA: nucleotidyltransferase family protein [Candidatus Acidoferrum sp.]|nr:nucleotidyltransferase family protein [Candidatus Acidoferrum sp.]